MRYEKDFISKLKGLDFETLENSAHSVFGLSNELKLNYFNIAWLEFARQNDGEPNISNRFPIGTPIDIAISGEFKTFFIENYKKVLREQKVWKYEYECSSPTIYRLFCQDVYPLKNGDGLIIVNSIKVEMVFNERFRKGSVVPASDYKQSNGLITQCSNCRKTKNVKIADQWDWVPLLVKKMPKNVSHSICPLCYDYFWKYYKQHL